MEQNKTSAIILANDTGFTPEKDKALLEIYGETLVGITYHRMKGLFEKSFVIVGSYGKISMYSRIIPEDIIPVLKLGHGEMAGFFTGLKACRTEYAFLVGSDMPMINRKAVQKILEQKDFDAVVPKHDNGKLEPLHALYRVKPTLKAVQQCINDEKSSFWDVILKLGNVQYMPIKEFQEVDPQLRTFFRINSELDYLLAKERLKNQEFSSRIKKAKSLKTGIIKQNETGNTIYYNVPGSEEDHEVIYNKRKGMWKCDCKHFAMKGTYCSHILAAKGAK